MKILIILLFTAFVSGCATQVNRQAYNSEAATHIKTVTISEIPDVEEYEVYIMAHPGISFGLIGGVIAAADMHSKSGRLTSAINPDETKLQNRLVEKLSVKLNELGYEAKLKQVDKESDIEKISAFLKEKCETDAVIALGVKGRYIAASPSTPYLPFVEAHARKYDCKSGELLYEDKISYGYSFPGTSNIHLKLPVDSQYQFNSMDDLEQNPQKAREGLYAGLEAVTEQISTDLKKN